MENTKATKQQLELALHEPAPLCRGDQGGAPHNPPQAPEAPPKEQTLEGPSGKIRDDGAEDADECENNFSAAPAHIGEVLIPVKDLEEWVYHPTVGAKGQTAIVSHIARTATDPTALEPILVLKTADGFAIIDGRKRWHAVQQAHPRNSDVAMRCIAFEGTDAEALQFIPGRACGSALLTDIQLGRLLLNLVRVAGISQKAICERFATLKKDQVSLKIKAAKAFEQYPSIFALLEEPERVAIDTCVRFGQFMKAASDNERRAVFKRAQQLSLAEKPVKAPTLLALLGIEECSKTKSSLKPNPFEPVSLEPVFGHDDQPVGAVELLADNVTRVRLPDPAVMSPEERKAAAAAFIEHIRAYFGLEMAIG